ncbi:MAG TPA: alpha/beta fold hydrolase [Gemmatirosa sp.]
MPAIRTAVRTLASFLLAGATAACADSQSVTQPVVRAATDAISRVVQWSDIAALPVAPYTARLAYGADTAHQFGELRLPTGTGPFPVAVVLHGGCWLNSYGLDQISQPAADLAKNGVATWTVEYRRIGDAGAGWTGTFNDVTASINYLRQLAARYPIDTTRVVLVGHSAGGQLALWAASRSVPPSGAPAAPTLRVRGVVSLAGIADLVAYYGTSGCNASVPYLMGGSPNQVPSRYKAVSPALRLPIGVPVRLVHGKLDNIVPTTQSSTFLTKAAAAGDNVTLTMVDSAGHFDLIMPTAAGWAAGRAAVLGLLK